jgi:tetratricopeptide (TPR) repeat protein/transglutaminase-like putative cysteine protease
MLSFVLLGLQVGLATADGAVPRGPSREPNPYRYDPAAWKSVPRRFLDDAPGCYLYGASTYLVEADGTVERVTHEIIRLNSRKAIDKVGDYRGISYDPSFQKLVLNEARVLKADGRSVPVAVRHLQLRDVDTDAKSYDRDKQLVISFPGLEVGDAIEVKYTVRGKNPEHGGRFFMRYNMGDDQFPMVLEEFRVRVPKEQTLKHAVAGGKLEPPSMTEDAKGRTYVWRARNEPQLPQDENLPSKEELRPAIVCSTFADWQEVAAWKRKLRDDCWECTPAIRKVVQDATSGLKTPLEKARALTYWVRRNIRYLSVGEQHRFTPHPPARVLDNRYGDCKDSTQLLAVMLKEAGVPVALATLGARDDGQVIESVPSPSGSHAILLVTIDGRQHWIDTTTSLCGWDFLPRDDRDRLCYVTDDKGIRLIRTPPLTADDNRYDQTTIVSIGADGSTRSERAVHYHGLAALAKRDDWYEVPAGERRRLVTAELQDANSRTRLVHLAVDEAKLRDLDGPVSARMVFETPDQFTPSGQENDREGSITDSKVWNRLVGYNLDPERQAPFEFSAPFESHHRYLIHLPPAYEIGNEPSDQTIRSKWGSFTMKVRDDGPRVIQIDFRTRLESARVEPADFEEFRVFHKEVARVYRGWLTIMGTLDQTNAPALEVVLRLAPDDTASAIRLARLYELNRMHTDAMRVLSVARHYQPDDLELVRKIIDTADTAAEKLPGQRDLVRRYPGEPRYALELGTTLTDAGDYAEARRVLLPLAARGLVTQRALAHYQLARCAFGEDKLEQALQHLQAALHADRNRAEAGGVSGEETLKWSMKHLDVWSFRGRIEERLKRPGDAEFSYREALKSDEKAIEPLEAVIRLALARNGKRDALDYLPRYARLVHDDVAGSARAADFYLRVGRDDEALALALRSRELGFHEKAQRVLGLVYLHRQDYEQAVFHLDKADLDPPVLEGLIRAHLALGHLREAVDLAGRLDRIAEPTPTLRRVCELTGTLARRRAAIARESKIPPDKAKAWQRAIDGLVCAEHAHAEGLPAARIKTLLAVAFRDGVDLGQAHALRGLLFLEEGRLTKALADAERAVTLCPKESRGFCVRGRVRFERGAAGALDDLTRAAELSQRKDGIILHWLATALFHAGRKDEALTTQRQAVKLRPNDAELTEQLREFEKPLK